MKITLDDEIPARGHEPIGGSSLVHAGARNRMGMAHARTPTNRTGRIPRKRLASASGPLDGTMG